MKTNVIFQITSAFVFMLLANVAYGQSELAPKSTLEALTATRWKQEGPTSYECFKEYGSDKMIFTFVYSGEKQVITSAFYLSNSIEWDFDERKVGKSTYGRFIVTKTEQNPVSIERIIEITEDRLVTQSVPNPNVTRMGNPNSVSTFIAVSK